MGRLRGGTDCEGLLAFVAEGDLLLAPTAPVLFFLPTLFRRAVAGMPDVVAGSASVEGLSGIHGLTDTPAAIPWLTNVVRARGRRLLDRGGHGGLPGLPHGRFGSILAVFWLGRRAR
jgi:hypothetical protein